MTKSRNRQMTPSERIHKDKDAYYRKAYGIGYDEYIALSQSQGGVCAICGQINSRDRALALDHDHETGAVRGLLCSSCNFGLGNFGDDPARLLAAIRYLGIEPRDPEHRPNASCLCSDCMWFGRERMSRKS